MKTYFELSCETTCFVNGCVCLTAMIVYVYEIKCCCRCW